MREGQTPLQTHLPQIEQGETLKEQFAVNDPLAQAFALTKIEAFR
jgi:hypothetical protein